MKIFLYRLILFFIPIIIIAYPLDLLISSNLKKSNSHAAKEYPVWNDIIDNQINPEISIYGNSRAWVQINPKIISDSLHLSTYNFGIDGHNFWLQYFRHRLLTNQNKKPKIILCSVDIFTLQKFKDLYNSDQFLPYMLNNPIFKEWTADYNGFTWVDYHIPLIRYYSKYSSLETAVKMYLKSNNPPQRVKGFQSQNKKWNQDFEKTKTELKNYSIKIDSNSVNLFHNFLKECKSDNIQVIMIYTPEYIEGQKFIKNRDELIQLYESISKKHGIKFINYSTHPICLNKTYFYNATHVNKEGSKLLTHIIAKDVKAILKSN